jgi:DNA-binding transcriptional regulator YhcF (GntR family)
LNGPRDVEHQAAINQVHCAFRQKRENFGETMIDIQLEDTRVAPIYAQVRRQIEAHIQNKQLAAGEALPSPATLAQNLSVDKGEIQRAYYELEQSGLVKKTTSRDFLGKEKVTYKIN